MTIDTLFDQITPESIQENQEFIIDKNWSQGRTVYGGLSAAMLYRTCKTLVASGRVMRSMTTNFVGPLLSETPFTISVEIIREGKNVSQVQARAIQNDKVSVVTQVCFGEKRASKIAVINDERHLLELPKKSKFIPQIPKVTPRFLKHIEL
ncbi:MAG: thioesterase family protein, partial [Pseudomonadota bacterium]